jgi:hypothetical protein
MDSFLIERVLEPALWRVEYYTGRNNFWYAKIFLALYFAGVMAPAFDWFEQGPFGAGVFVALGLMIAGATWSQYFLIVTAERKQRPGLRNYYRLFWYARYTMVLCCCVIGILLWIPKILLVVSFVGACSVHYFIACSPMPPKWKEAREKKAQERKLVAEGA